MEKRLSGIPFTIVRMDDILISGKSDKEHLQNLEKVLAILHKHEIKLKKPKCIFFSKKGTYLGFLINKHGIFPLKEKIEDMLNAKSPESVTELKSFLGMINYYGRHLPNLASVLEPLHNLPRKNIKCRWGRKERTSFETVKELLCSPKLLVHYSNSLPLIIACDASPYTVRAVLSHTYPGNSERPIDISRKKLFAN